MSSHDQTVPEPEPTDAADPLAELRREWEASAGEGDGSPGPDLSALRLRVAGLVTGIPGAIPTRATMRRVGALLDHGRALGVDLEAVADVHWTRLALVQRFAPVVLAVPVEALWSEAVDRGRRLLGAADPLLVADQLVHGEERARPELLLALASHDPRGLRRLVEVRLGSRLGAADCAALRAHLLHCMTAEVETVVHLLLVADLLRCDAAGHELDLLYLRLLVEAGYHRLPLVAFLEGPGHQLATWQEQARMVVSHLPGTQLDRVTGRVTRAPFASGSLRRE